MTNDLPDWERAVRIGVDVETTVKNEFWLAKHGERIKGYNEVSGGDVELYVVPAGKIFYLLYAGLYLQGPLDKEGTLYAAWGDDSLMVQLFYAKLPASTSCAFYASKQFLRLTEGEKIRAKDNAIGACVVNFYGYEIDAEDE